jgi:hypothetical protein
MFVVALGSDLVAFIVMGIDNFHICIAIEVNYGLCSDVTVHVPLTSSLIQHELENERFFLSHFMT